MRHSRDDYQGRVVDQAGIIPADEPVFLLRAKDVTAPRVVRTWARLAAEAGASPEMVKAAYEHADLMTEWQEEHGFKVPDMPEGE
jgi:hypothetical protein